MRVGVRVRVRVGVGVGVRVRVGVGVRVRVRVRVGVRVTRLLRDERRRLLLGALPQDGLLVLTQQQLHLLNGNPFK